jgi:hypothetical protein
MSRLRHRLASSRFAADVRFWMSRLGIAPHIADKILNHQAGTISGVAAVYLKHQFLDRLPSIGTGLGLFPD